MLYEVITEPEMKLRVLDLFSGIGGFSLGLHWAGGFETVGFCEIEEYPRKVLELRFPGVRDRPKGPVCFHR